jgi:hypothetical protein
MDTTGQALIAFWKNAGNKGLMNANSASGLRAASSQVLSVLDDWAKLDVAALDTEDVFRRFVNKRGQEFTPTSLAAYRRRFNQAVSEFLEYTNNPEKWKPRSAERPSGARREKSAVAKSTNVEPESHESFPPASSTPGRSGLVEYPFPLREGRFAYLRLPPDLKQADVKRLIGFLNTLAEDAASE